MAITQPKEVKERKLLMASTGINEQLRRDLDITRDEYALCKYTHYRQADPRTIKPGWCTDEKDDVAYFVGISRQALRPMIFRMETKGLIEVSGVKGWFRTTPRWVDLETAGKETLHKEFEGKRSTRKETFHGNGKKLYTETDFGGKFLSETNNVYKLDIKEEDSKKENTPVAEKSTVSLTTFSPDKIENLELTVVEEVEFSLDTTVEQLCTGAVAKPATCKTPATDIAAEIISHINTVTGSQFRTTAKANLALVNARMKEGATADDLKLIIAHKNEQWGTDAKMREHLCPETLFRAGHYEKYINAARKWQQDKSGPVADRYAMNDAPKAQTPDEMVREMSLFYRTHIHDGDDGRGLLSAAQKHAQTQYGPDRLNEVVRAFCSHRIGKGLARETFEQQHGAFCLWLQNEKKREQRGQGGPTVFNPSDIRAQQRRANVEDYLSMNAV